MDLSTCVLRFEKFAQKMLLVLQQQYSLPFFLRAFSACMLLHDCRSRVASLATSDQAVRRDASRFRFPARPTPVCTSFQLSCGASLPDCHRQSFHMHGIPASSHFCRSALALLFHQPVVWAAALLLHLRLLCYTWPSGALLAKDGLRCTSIPLSRSSGPSALAGSCSSQAALPSQ